MSDEIIKASDTLDNNFNQTLDNFNNPKVWEKFHGSCLKPGKVSFTPKKIKTLYREMLI